MADQQQLGAILRQGEPLVIWDLGPVVEGALPGWPAPTTDPVGYRFRNGHAGIPDLPCRTAARAELPGRVIEPPLYWSSAAIYAPADNRRVEFNSFAYTPTLRRRWCRTTLTVPRSGDYPFDLTTRGGIRIRVNGQETVCFEPFTRNENQRSTVTLPLREGANEVLVHMEDLFERDTNWFFELTYQGQDALSIGLSVQADAALIETVRAVSDSIRPSRDLFVDEPFHLLVDHACDTDISVAVRVVSQQHDRATLLDGTYTLRAGETVLDLGPSAAIRDGYHSVFLDFLLGEVTVSKHIGAAFQRRLIHPVAPTTEKARKAEALAYAATEGDPRPGRVLAMLATDTVDPVLLHAVLAATLELIEKREDCSDFVMVPLLWIWGLYEDRLPEVLRTRIRHAVLTWRYWVDEPGNDVMWFWSENHVLCFHVSQYIAGRLFPEDRFTCSGRTGAVQASLAEERLNLWFDAIEEHGFVEWNSAAYYPIDFIGIFGLYQWCDGALKERCRGLLDRLFVMTGLHTLEGIPAGSMGRAYDKELRAGAQTELAPFCRVAFGRGWLNSGVAALPLYCLSDYEAPAAAVEAALAIEPFEAGYTQGYEHGGKLKLWKDRAAMLSTVVEHEQGQAGHQQHVIDIRLAGHPMARLWINHPGEDDPWGSHRPSYWSGNGILPQVAQMGDTAMLIYDLGDAPEIGFTHAYLAADGFDEVRLENGWLLARSGDGYAAIWASSALLALTDGPTAGHEFRAEGTRCGWVARVGSGDGAKGFAAFAADMTRVAPEFDADARRLSLRHPDGSDLSLDWRDGPSRNGQSTAFTEMTIDPQVRRLAAAAGAA